MPQDRSGKAGLPTPDSGPGAGGRERFSGRCKTARAPGRVVSSGLTRGRRAAGKKGRQTPITPLRLGRCDSSRSGSRVEGAELSQALRYPAPPRGSQQIPGKRGPAGEKERTPEEQAGAPARCGSSSVLLPDGQTDSATAGRRKAWPLRRLLVLPALCSGGPAAAASSQAAADRSPTQRPARLCPQRPSRRTVRGHGAGSIHRGRACPGGTELRIPLVTVHPGQRAVCQKPVSSPLKGQRVWRDWWGPGLGPAGGRS